MLKATSECCFPYLRVIADSHSIQNELGILQILNIDFGAIFQLREGPKAMQQKNWSGNSQNWNKSNI